MTAFRFKLYSDEGDELGEFVTAAPRWGLGESFITGDGRRFIILDMLDVPEDSEYCGLWEVKPLTG